ncbi:hypothetical protein Q31b_26590 [Novipirellula aureliae]|uniref:Uncharacterized protein n=1 Tax=Novipirellula aureliae TaxID=2527966 RepID=A0A5C6DWU9_9BACT|nr:hypothetical protein [Novipirellula aureliae]TWU41220.1 hypothetical protein Q31b_26590 [Novipirellula aureliae]
MRTLQCDVDHGHTPAVLKKVCIAAARNPSYVDASRNLEDLAELKVSAKQCQRIAIRIGNERLDEQQKRIDAYTSASIPDQQHGQSNEAPANSWDNRVAVVQCDGGRVQIRDAYWGNEKPAERKHRWWRETQAAVLQTYQSTRGLNDPTPEVPECLKDSLWVVPKLNEIHRQHTPAGSSEEIQESPPDTSEQTFDETKDDSAKAKKRSREPRWSGGDPLVKTVVATRRGYDHLGQAMAGEAFARGFNKAKSKAFMGDGLKVNWSLWSAHFSHYTPITDLMHALSYVYGAAIASRSRIEEGWSLYLVWLGWTWSGDVSRVIVALQEIAAGDPEVPEAVRRAITYLSNNAQRMKYAEYRKLGLPITTSPVESTQKQINKRIKGTEKFWRDESLEPLLQLKADDLSETHDRDAFWKRRGQRNDGFRHRCRKTKIKDS